MTAENPVFLRLFEGGVEAVKLSDLLTRRELKRTRMYGLVLKPCGLVDSLGITLQIGPARLKKLSSSTALIAASAIATALSSTRCARTSSGCTRRPKSAGGSARPSRSTSRPEKRSCFSKTTTALPSPAPRRSSSSTAYFGEKRPRLPDSLASWVGERRRMPRLTPREREILNLIADGRTNAEIAGYLCVSPGKVRKHLENIYAKLGVHTRGAAAAFVRERGLLARDR